MIIIIIDAAIIIIITIFIIVGLFVVIISVQREESKRESGEPYKERQHEVNPKPCFEEEREFKW